MVKVTYCDVCHTILDRCIAGDPDSTDYYSGTFRYYNGSIIMETQDLCGSCAKKVRAFINTLKEENK